MDTDTAIAAVDRLAELGKQASGLDIAFVTTKDLGPGLPPMIPIGFDHKANGLINLRPFVENWRLYPERRKGKAVVSTLQSFCDLINRHKTDYSVIFAQTNWPNPSLTAVIDYHEKDKPQFNEHRVIYPFPLTDEFKAWVEKDGKVMTQLDFAAFIEERASELSDATDDEQREFETLFRTKIASPADMIMLSRGLEVNVDHRVKNIVTLQSGEGQMVYEEQHLNAEGNKLVVPGLFMVSVPAFLDGEPVRLPARLRYRASGGSVNWFFQLYRWKQILRDRVVADLLFAQEETDLPTYEGSPEAS